jgi:integrase
VRSSVECFLLSGSQAVSRGRRGLSLCNRDRPAHDYANARKALGRAVRAARIGYAETERVSFHCLRHGAASALIRAVVTNPEHRV